MWGGIYGEVNLKMIILFFWFCEKWKIFEYSVWNEDEVWLYICWGDNGMIFVIIVEILGFIEFVVYDGLELRLVF